LLGRRHTANQAKQAVEAARKVGFDNVSIDLMFGLPYQSVSGWAHTLEEALGLGVDHFSLYALTLESGTPMEAEVRAGRLPEPDPDLAAEMYLLAQQSLASAGYEQYEISNWAKSGDTSRHNLTYWLSQAYLGVGPGAHSYLFANGAPSLDALGPLGARFACVRPPRTYIDGIMAWKPSEQPLTDEVLRSVDFLEGVEAQDEAIAMGETMMMGLRLNKGVADADFRRRFGRSIAEAFPRATADCLELGLLEWRDGHLRLLEQSRLVGNEAFHRFLPLHPVKSPGGRQT